VQAGAVLALVALVLAAGSTPAPTLKVGIVGAGSVSSSPAGIACKPRCTMHVRKGARVTLTASPTGSGEFSHWSAPCGTTYTCTVKMTRSRAVTAYFKAAPAQPTPVPLPPAPPAAKPGHYVGTYSDGSLFDFDVVGSRVTNLTFDFNGECPDGSTIAGPAVQINGSFAIGSDGSWSGPITINFSNSSGSAHVAGTVNSSGSASGTLSVSLTFHGGPTCTSTGTWTAQDQS
jgi:hypothetical protein